MKRLILELQSMEGDVLDCVELEDYVIAGPDAESADLDTVSLLAEVEAFLETIVVQLEERNVRPAGGLTALRMAVGEILLAGATEEENGEGPPSDEVRLPIKVEANEVADEDGEND